MSDTSPRMCREQRWTLDPLQYDMQVRTAEPKHNSRAALPISDLIITGLPTGQIGKTDTFSPVSHCSPDVAGTGRLSKPSPVPGTEIEPYALARRAVCVIQSMRPT